MLHPKGLLVVGLLVALSGCASGRTPSPVTPSLGGGALPDVEQTGHAPAHWLDFPTPTQASNPWGIAVGSDGALWFTETAHQAVGRIDMAGGIQEFPLPVDTEIPLWIVNGGDGLLYVSDPGDPNKSPRTSRIISISTTGITNEVLMRSGHSSSGLALGPDGHVWIGEGDPFIARLNSDRTVTEFRLPSPVKVSSYIAVGPDGDIWFTDSNSHSLGKVDPSNGHVTVYSTGSSCVTFFITTVGRHLWIFCGGSAQGYDTNGRLVSKLTGTFGNAQSFSNLTRDTIWFVTQVFPHFYLGTLNVTTGKIVLHQETHRGVGGGQIALGPDGNIWWGADGTDGGRVGLIYVYVLQLLQVTPNSLQLTKGAGAPVSVSESHYSGSWTAASSDPNVATAMQSGSHTFTITAQGVGTCTIRVSDTVGNSFPVTVTVTN